MPKTYKTASAISTVSNAAAPFVSMSGAKASVLTRPGLRLCIINFRTYFIIWMLNLNV